MKDLNEKYKKYLKENTDSKISFEDWQRDILPPYISDNFMIGPEGAFEYGQDEEEFSDWDVTLMDGLEDDNLKETFNGKKPALENVLSLFDGMSCGQIALNRAAVSYGKYYSSEIDRFAMQATQHNYPNTIQLGDIMKLKGSDLPKIDLLMGGSPCQSFSNAGNNQGFSGKSGLFYEYVRMLVECNPKYFLLENVKMKKEWRNIITKELGVEPVLINSNLVSAQNRERLYWTNIPIGPLADKKIYIEDILDKEFDEKYWLKERNTELLLRKVNIDNAPDIACIDVYNKRVKFDRKCPTLTLPHHNSLRLLQNGRIRKLTPTECERLQNVPIGYTDCNLSDIHRYSMLGNGWTIDVIAHIFSQIPH